MSSTEIDPRSKYRLPTHAVEARLFLCDGRTEDVTLFLRSASESHRGPESLDEFLNGPRTFLPVKSNRGGKNLLVHREAIQRVQVDENAPILSHMKPDLIPCVDLVRIEMTDAVVLEGTLASLLPPESLRMSDFFNLDDIFIPLEVQEGVTYINKKYITVVWL